MRNALLFSVFAALLACCAMFVTKGPAFSPAGATYRDSLNLYILGTLHSPSAFAADPASAEFRKYSGDPAGREYAYFAVYRGLLSFLSLNAAMKALSFVLALLTAFFFYRTCALLLPGPGGAAFGAALLLALFFSMDSFYFGQNRTFGAAICAAWFFFSLSGRGWTTPAFILLFFPFYPYLSAAALAYSLLYPFFDRKDFSENRAAFLALAAFSLAALALAHSGPDTARNYVRIFAYKSQGMLGEKVSAWNPLHLLLYFVLNLNEHNALYRVFLPAVLAAGAALRLARRAPAAGPGLSHGFGLLAAAHAGTFLLLYPFSPFFASRQLVFFIPFAAALWLAKLTRERWGEGGLKYLGAAAVAFFVLAHPALDEIDNYSPYRPVYAALRNAPGALVAGGGESRALDGVPLYSGASVFYSRQLTETWSGRAPGFDFSGREAAQDRAFCAPDLRAVRAFARENRVTHFLVEPSLQGPSCPPGASAALLKLAAKSRPLAAGHSGPVFLLAAADLDHYAGK